MGFSWKSPSIRCLYASATHHGSPPGASVKAGRGPVSHAHITLHLFLFCPIPEARTVSWFWPCSALWTWFSQSSSLAFPKDCGSESYLFPLLRHTLSGSRDAKHHNLFVPHPDPSWWVGWRPHWKWIVCLLRKYSVYLRKMGKTHWWWQFNHPPPPLRDEM